MKGKVYWRWGLTAFLTVCAILVFYDAFYQGGTLQHILGKLAQVLAPVFYGLAMAYLLTPLVKWFERGILWSVGKLRKRLPDKPLKHGKGLLRAGAILLTWAVVLALTYWLMSVLVPQLIDSVTMLIKNARYYYYKVYRWADTWLKEHPEIGSWANDVLSDYYNNAEAYYRKIYDWADGLLDSENEIAVWLAGLITERYTDGMAFLTDKVLPWAQKAVVPLTNGIWSGIRGAVGFAFDLIVGIIVSIYLMGMKEKSLARCCKAVYAAFSEKKADAVMRGTRTVDRIFSGFVRGKLLDSLIIGILCFIGCSILKMPYTPLVSVVVGVTNVIPFFGPFLGAIPSAFLILLVSPLKCLYFIIFIILLQQLDGNVIGPKILGDSTGISSFWVIVAILVGGGFFGVPVFACLRMLVKWLMDRRLTRRGMPTEASAYVERKEALRQSRTAGNAEENPEEESEEKSE